MRAYPLMQLKAEFKKDRTREDLDLNIENVVKKVKVGDYSKVIKYLALAIINANKLADIEADE